MKEEIYKCDHCGKIMDVIKDYIDAEFEGPGFYETMDLCEDCYRELKEFIESYKESF